MKKEKTPLHPEGRKLSRILLVLTVLTVLNICLTASIVGLLAGIVILIMIGGIRKGSWFLTKSLSPLLLGYAGINFVVLILTAALGGSARISSLIWLGIYSGLLILFGVLLRSKALQEYLKTAPPPEEKEKKITFFKGGWRDL